MSRIRVASSPRPHLATSLLSLSLVLVGDSYRAQRRRLIRFRTGGIHNKAVKLHFGGSFDNGLFRRAVRRFAPRRFEAATQVRDARRWDEVRAGTLPYLGRWKAMQ